MPEFTDQQFEAINAKVSVALAAGAGCGKTFVLTERFLACLDPRRPGGPFRLDQLTAITFTERAGARCGSGSAGLPGTPQAPRNSTPAIGCEPSAIWIRRGFPRSTRSAARCSARMPWRLGSIRTFRSSTPRPPRQFSSS